MALYTSLSSWFATSVPLADFTVDSTDDYPDVSPGDAVCAATNGTCTLRAAVQEANALPGGDEVFLPGGNYALDIPGTDEDFCMSGDLDIRDDLVLIGSGAASTVIDGDGLDRIFHIEQSTGAFPGGVIDIFVNGVTLKHGDAKSKGKPKIGGAILSQDANVTITDSVISQSKALMGGGIYCSASGYWGPVYCKLIGTDVVGNAADMAGGGVYAFNNFLIVEDGNVLGNKVTGKGVIGGIATGGGIAVAFADTELKSTTIAFNAAGGCGGLANQYGPLHMVNSTVSSNLATVFYAGGLCHLADATTVATIVNSTIARNRSLGATMLHGIYEQGSSVGGIYASAGYGATVITLKNSIIAGNVHKTHPDCFGNVMSLGYNVLYSTSGCELNGEWDDSNIIGVMPAMQALKKNGGPTTTHALKADSIAIDAIPADMCTDMDGTTITIDQRGLPRPVGNGCDAGAYEWQLP